MPTPPSSSRPKPRPRARPRSGSGNGAGTDPASTTRTTKISAPVQGKRLKASAQGSRVQSSKPSTIADLNPSPANGEARHSILKPVRPSRFSIELTPERRERWQRAADIAIPNRKRNLAPWLVPLIDKLAEAKIESGCVLMLSSQETEELDRLLDAYLVTEAFDPGLPLIHAIRDQIGYQVEGYEYQPILISKSCHEPT